MSSDDNDDDGWGGAITNAIHSASDEEDEEGINVVSESGLSGDAGGEKELPYVALLQWGVAALKTGEYSEEEFVEGVLKLVAVTDAALRVYDIPTVKKDLPGKLTDLQNEIVSGLEVQLHRLKEGLTMLLSYPESRDPADLDEGLRISCQAMWDSRDIQKRANAERERIREREQEEKARRAQKAAEADDDDSE